MKLLKHLLPFVTIALLLNSCGSVPITGRKQLTLVSPAEVLQASAEQYHRFIQEAPLANNTAEGRRVFTVSKRLVQATEQYLKQNGFSSMLSQLAWEVNVVNSPQVNAFCMPGGKIVVYTGILPLCKTDEQLAAVISHEISHAIAQHSVERLSNEVLRKEGGRLLSRIVGSKVTNGTLSTAIEQAYGIGTTVFISLPYGRSQEYEADKMGMVFMALAGYRPEGAIELWQRMAQSSSGSGLEFLSTHPSDVNRIKALQEYLPEAQKHYKQRVEETIDRSSSDRSSSRVSSASKGRKAGKKSSKRRSSRH